MDVVIAILALLAGVGIVAWAWAKGIERFQRTRARARVADRAAAPWTVMELPDRVASSARGGPATSVVLVHLTGDGKTTGRIVVATIQDSDPDWTERMLAARAEAASRAELLNTQP